MVLESAAGATEGEKPGVVTPAERTLSDPVGRKVVVELFKTHPGSLAAILVTHGKWRLRGQKTM
jgi:hypothetical protein